MGKWKVRSCSGCNRMEAIKGDEEFQHFTPGDRYCRDCRSDFNTSWCERNPEKKRLANRRWRETHRKNNVLGEKA